MKFFTLLHNLNTFFQQKTIRGVIFKNNVCKTRSTLKRKVWMTTCLVFYVIQVALAQWVVLSTYTGGEVIFFANINDGWTIQEQNIRHTSDGGVNWTLQYSHSGHLKSIFFVDADNGWAGAGDGTIFHTSNGGVNWSSQTSGTTSTILDISFVDTNTGWAVGGMAIGGGSSTYIILHTSDGGMNWSSQASGSNFLSGVDFVDANNGWATGANGIILHTSNGGMNWSSQTSGVTGTLYDVSFVDANNGWTVSSFGTILHTSDGGMNWSSQTSGTTAHLYDVSFVDTNNGWVVGNSNNGPILHTSDGGMNWSTQTSPHPTVEGLFMLDANNGWICGTHTFYTSNGGLPVELVHLFGEQHTDHIQLHWQTASETINEGFEMQRSRDGKDWEKLSFIPGHGSTNEPQNYSFDDVRPHYGINYYRLRQIDLDGTFEYSKVVSVHFQNVSNTVEIFPNPFTESLEILIPEDTIVNEIAITDLNGKVIKTFSNHQNKKLNLSDLDIGIYYLELVINNQQIIKKIVKQ